ncbi:hypothetical protein CBR_g53845 [Chara braunii]|uniref:Uncharacterized protein n=1 Tax=Chara braunii TaxID=69332 RepID=A0A388MBH5_CHABU|nr:hypothetical protein CBR_g53845 [Chara braunii]|eukprot:GBG91865.1 hypothetical protein CBR_g53845 [Chara braunii]
MALKGRGSGTGRGRGGRLGKVVDRAIDLTKERGDWEEEYDEGLEEKEEGLRARKHQEEWRKCTPSPGKMAYYAFKFERRYGERVSYWLELLEQVFNRLTPAEKFAQLYEYVWWELRPDVERIVTDAQGNWDDFKKEVPRKYKLGDGLLTVDEEKVPSQGYPTPEQCEQLWPLDQTQLRNYTPHTARKSKGGNTSKEPAQAPLPPQEETSIDIGEDEEDQDEVLRGEENKRAEQRAKKRKTNDGKEKVGEKSKKKWRSIPGEEERLRHPMVTRDSAGMPLYKKGDNVRQFLREYENHAIIREWDVPTMMRNVTGVGECRKAMEEMAMKVFGWQSFKVAMWAKYADLRRDEIEDNITFDGTNLEDFEDSIGLCAERNRWDDEEKLEQAAIKVTPRERETVRTIRKGSDTWGGFLVEMRKVYPLSIQRQKKRQLFQEQGVWIGRRNEGLEMAERKNGNETPPRQGEGKFVRNMEIPEVQGKERRIARKEEGRDKSPEEKEEEEKGKEKRKGKMEEAGLSVRAETTSSMKPLKDMGRGG